MHLTRVGEMPLSVLIGKYHLNRVAVKTRMLESNDRAS
jgi:hypothetical protein